MDKSETCEAMYKAEAEGLERKCMGLRVQSLTHLNSNRNRIHFIIITVSRSSTGTVKKAVTCFVK